MIKEAIAKVLEIAATCEPVETDHGTQYTQPLFRAHEPNEEPTGQPLVLSTLTAVAKYVDADPDGEDLSGYILEVEQGGSSVRLASPRFGHHKQRTCLLKAAPTGGLATNMFDQSHDAEEMSIMLRTLFQRGHDDDLSKLIEIVGALKHEESAEFNDDGVAQRVAIRKGTTSTLEWAALPPTVLLHPFRVFPGEIDEQPQSEFILRVRSSRDQVFAALFEADGGAWKPKAAQLVADKLDELIERDDAPLIVS